MHTAKNKIAVIGAGWLGLPLAARLSRSYQVFATTRTESRFPEIRENGTTPLLLSLEPELDFPIPSPLEDCEVLIIAISPGRKVDVETTYPKMLGRFFQKVSKTSIVKKVLFFSSTAVYPSLAGPVSELSPVGPERPTAKAIFLAELALREAFPNCSHILRLGGLAGPHRNPGRFLSGRGPTPGRKNPVNLLHLEDAIGTTEAILEHPNLRDELFNICSPVHPSREEFYTFAAKQIQAPPPEFIAPDLTATKIISPSLLVKSTGYNFVYSSPMDFPLDE